MTTDEDVNLIKMLVSTIKEIKDGSLETQKRIFEHLERQTKLYEEIRNEVLKQNKILENHTHVKMNV